MREVINQLIDGNVKTEFENDSYLDALTLTDVMFHRSNTSVRLLTGPGLDGFLSELQKSFIDLLDRLKKTGGAVRILLLSKDVPTWLHDLTKAYDKTLTIHRALPTKPMPHFIVCDSKMSRQEEVHEAITDASDATTIKARVSFNETSKAEVLENYFDLMWKSVSDYPINQAS
ncbi:MAG TPA: hypothetical protein DDZ88_01885 [Verrucomicrobiales bacterium]|nr:hypothetical protein [Verrucomicrobiales bacterium]